MRFPLKVNDWHFLEIKFSEYHIQTRSVVLSQHSHNKPLLTPLLPDITRAVMIKLFDFSWKIRLDRGLYVLQVENRNMTLI